MTAGEWQGFEAWTLENDAIRAVIVPGLGAKIVSLVDKAAGHEWLALPTHPVRERTYADTFTDHDLAGWDEMFPTINVCPSPFDASIELPDHGEVWALPWEVVERSSDSITLRVKGKALDYTLTRVASLQPDGLRLEYSADNHSDQIMPFLWAAHPLFNGDEHTRIQLPDSVKRVVNVAEHPDWGPNHGIYDWPQATLANGDERRIDDIGAPSRKDYRKFYVTPDQPVASASLTQSDIRRVLALSWDGETVPYLGIWIDEGTFTRITTVALEPATGYYDSLARTIANERVSRIPAGGQARWWLQIRFAPQ